MSFGVSGWVGQGQGVGDEDSQPFPALGFLVTLSAAFWVSVGWGGPVLAPLGALLRGAVGRERLLSSAGSFLSKPAKLG